MRGKRASEEEGLGAGAPVVQMFVVAWGVEARNSADGQRTGIFVGQYRVVRGETSAVRGHGRETGGRIGGGGPPFGILARARARVVHKTRGSRMIGMTVAVRPHERRETLKGAHRRWEALGVAQSALLRWL